MVIALIGKKAFAPANEIMNILPFDGQFGFRKCWKKKFPRFVN